MAEDMATLETRPPEPERRKTRAPIPPRKNEDPSHPNEGKSGVREAHGGDPSHAPLPRWPFLLVGLVVAIFAAIVLYIIFRPHPDVLITDAYWMFHSATIPPRIAGQIATVPVDDNCVVKAG